MAEEWRDIPGYEGLYQVSSLGRVKRVKHWKVQDTKRLNKYYRYRKLPEKILSIMKRPNGYCSVNLSKGKIQKQFWVHRLVALAFLPHSEEEAEVNHKDCNPSNNALSNLEWCTHEYNINYGDRTAKAAAKFEKKVRCIETGIVYSSGKAASKSTGALTSKISLVCNKKRKTAGGFHWEFA